MQLHALHSFASFIQPLPLTTIPTSRRRPHLTKCNINRTSDPSREDEIAAKIANFRKQNRLKSQSDLRRRSSNPGDATKSDVRGTANSYSRSSGLSYDDLPDWKKEQVLENQIADAEKFFYGKAKDSEAIPELNTQSPEDPADYQPKVSTWGVFPRPDNISKTFGGGRRIRMGGVEMDSSESQRRDDAVKKKLAAYRASRGIDSEKEEAHREQIEEALHDAEKLMKRTLPYEAVEKLEKVTDFTSDRSRFGGNVLLSLALAYEAVGRRQDARDIYVRLRKNSFPEISGKAKQLLQGFAAMETLQVDDDTRSKGYRVTRFTLPDVTSASDKKYETVVFGNDDKTSRPEKLSVGVSLVLFAVMTGPALLILALILWRR